MVPNRRVSREECKNRYVAMVSIAPAALASSGAAQTAKDLVGTWTLDFAGAFGVNPKGYVMFDANSHFGALLIRSDLLSTRRIDGQIDKPWRSREPRRMALASFFAIRVLYTKLDLPDRFSWHDRPRRKTIQRLRLEVAQHVLGTYHSGRNFLRFTRLPGHVLPS